VATALFRCGYGAAYDARKAAKEPAVHCCRPRTEEEPASAAAAPITAADIDLAYVRPARTWQAGMLTRERC
jgi:hypothetical protein